MFVGLVGLCGWGVGMLSSVVVVKGGNWLVRGVAELPWKEFR